MISGFRPAYISLHRSGELANRIERLNAMIASCRLCPRACAVNRLKDERGVCDAGLDLVVSSAFPHFGEEPPLVGSHGSGTIFLSHCSLRCVFCQNYDISHHEEGSAISSEELAQLMVALQGRGCHNINLVTPTQYVPQIVAALPAAIAAGLRIPLVYNCGGYESLEVIRLLERIVDIYMPDMKFSTAAQALAYCAAPDYPEIVRSVLREMHRQVGVLSISANGIAERGLLIRHLVMPQGLAGTEDAMRFIAEELSRDSYVNIMDQYYPHYQAPQHPEINRRITPDEYREALAIARACGLHRGLTDKP